MTGRIIYSVDEVIQEAFKTNPIKGNEIAKNCI